MAITADTSIRELYAPLLRKDLYDFMNFFNYLAENKLDVVLPTSDYAAKYLSEFKSILLDKVHFIVPDLNIFMMGYDKNKLMAVCEANKIPHPSTLDLSKLDHGQEIAQFNFPAPIKAKQNGWSHWYYSCKKF